MLKELREKRGALVKEIKGLAELINKEKRDFTTEEREKWESLNKEIDDMAGRIAAAERVNDLDAEMSRSVNEGRILPGRGDYTPEGFGTRTLETDTGDRVPVVSREQRMVDVFRNKWENELPDGIKPNEIRMYKMIRGAATGDWSGCEVEKRVMGIGVGATGGFTAPPVTSLQIYDLTRNKMRMSQAGMGIVPLESPEQTFVKASGDPTAFWRNEHGQITESDATLEPIIMRAKAVGCLVRVSLELLEDAPNAESVVRNSIAQALALEVDRVCLFGTGVGEPKGLYHHAGVNEQSLGANGAIPTNFDAWSQAVQSVWSANGEPNAAIFSPRTAGTLDRLVNGNGDPLPPPDSYKNLLKLVTNQVPNDLEHGTATTASASIVGDYRQCLLGVRTMLNLKIAETGTGSSGDEAFSRMQVFVRAYIRCDFAPIYPTHFCKVTGILA